MNKKVLLTILGAIVLLGGWYAFRPERLFINETVNESFPTTTTEANTNTAPVVLSQGHFRGVSHAGKGVATIYEINGKKVLRFTEFEVSNGPDVQIYLVAANDATDDATVTNAGFISLGPIKGNKGDQNYDVPADADINKYRAVTVWCKRFGKNFATAPLAVTEMLALNNEPRALLTGTFHGVAHETKGVASIYQVGGKHILRFTEFETSNGPDVQVYLGIATDANDDATVTNAGFYHLAALKGNRGDQNYEIPSDVDVTKYKSVTVWCRRFGKNFGTAPLAVSGTNKASL
jgi:hypothetical protein